MKRIFLGFAFAVGLVGCGGENPITALQKNIDQAFPELQLPFSETQASSYSITGYSASNDGFTFTGLSGSQQIQIVAPADGVVIKITEIDGANDYVTIYHSRYLTSRISMSTISAREGDSVKAGEQIGSASNFSSGITDAVKLTIYLNGRATCPLSFFKASVLTTINGKISSPCIN